MSWWDTGKGDDVIGDAPADLMIDTLQEISEEGKQQSRPKASLQELVDGFAKALQDAPFDPAEARGSVRLVIKRSREPDITANPQNANDRMVAPIRAGLRKIAAKYQERWDRNPRLGELTEILSFALASQPERFLAVPPDLDIDQILAEGST